jgi:hypothetical protein
VRLTLHDRLQVLQIPGVAKLFGFNGTHSALPQAEIKALRTGLLNGVHAEPHHYLKVWHRARVKSGPRQEMVGILPKKENREWFVISLGLIGRSLAEEVDSLELEPIRTSTRPEFWHKEAHELLLESNCVLHK